MNGFTRIHFASEFISDRIFVLVYRTLGCGNHVCEDVCHPGDCGVCALLPRQVTRCCCGQTPLAELSAQPRASCLDPVPTCDKICNKPMACGPPGRPRISHHGSDVHRHNLRLIYTGTVSGHFTQAQSQADDTGTISGWFAQAQCQADLI